MKKLIFNKILYIFGMLVIVGATIFFVSNKDKSYELTMYIGGAKYKSTYVGKNGKIRLPEAPKKEGYTFVGWYANGKKITKNTKITKNLKIKAKYVKKTYTITFDDGNGNKNKVKVKYKELVDIPSDPERENYTFEGWYLGNKEFNFKTKIKSNLKLVAKWSRLVTNYKVEHYLMHRDGNYSNKPDEIENIAEYAGEEVTVKTKQYKGYTIPSAKKITVNGDGSTIVKYYYAIKKYKLTIIGDKGIEQVSGSGTYFYGDRINIKYTLKPGYLFSSFSKNVDNNIYTMPDSNVTIKINTIANDVKYVVKHYKMNIDGSTYAAPIIEENSGETDSLVTPDVHQYEGFTSPKAKTVTINGRGNTIVNYYYTRNKYTLKLDADKGIKKVNGEGKYYYEEEVNITADVKDGYTFAKWSNGNTSEDFTYKIGAKDETLKAETNLITYNITYNLNGGFLQNKVDTYTVESEDINLGQPTKNGYTFIKWLVNNNESDGIIKHGTTGNLDIEAIFKENVRTSYKVEYYFMDVDGNNYTKDEKRTEEISGLAESTIDYTPSDVVGFEKPILKDKNDKEVSIKDLVIEEDGSTILKYYYPRKKYKLTITYINDLDENDTDGIKEITKTGNYYYQSKVNISIEVIDGFEFIKWSNETKEKEFVYTITSDENQSIEAHIKRKTHNVTFDSNGGTAVDKEEALFGKPIKEPAAPIKDYYDFIGWYYKQDNEEKQWNFNEDVMPNNDISLYAKWKIRENTVIFDATGGKFNDGQGTYNVTGQKYNTKIEAPEAPTKDGYTFVGWYKTKDGSGDKWDFDKNLMPDEGIILYAKWEAKKYTVTYDSNKGNGSSTPKGTVENTEHIYGEESDLNTAQYSRDGYTFLGFSKTQYNDSVDECSDCITKANNLTTDDNITLYAVWKANTYTITYNSNKGKGSIEPTGKVENTTHTYDKKSDLSKNKYSRNGYKFLGWSKSADSKEIITDAYNLKTEGNVTLYAVWEIINYTIDLDSNGGDLNNNYKKEYTVEDNFELEKPTKSGYNFDGWYVKDSSTRVDKITTGMTGNLELEARWSGINYTVVYKVGNKELSRDTFRYGDTHKVNDAKTINYNISYDTNGFEYIPNDTVSVTLDSWKLKDSKDNKIYKSGDSIEDLIVPESTGEIIYLVATDIKYPTIDLPDISDSITNTTYGEYEFNSWTLDGNLQTGTITVNDDIELIADISGTIDTDKYINDIISNKTYISSTLNGVSITADIEKVNENITSIINENSNIVNCTKNLIDTDGVNNIIFRYNGKEYKILNSSSVYTTLKQLATDITSTSKESYFENRKLSSLYSSTNPKKVTLQVNVGNNTLIKDRSSTSISYDATFTSDYVVSASYWAQLGASVMKQINNNYIKGSDRYEKRYRIIPPTDPNDYVIYLQFHPYIGWKTMYDYAEGAGFKTALKNLLGDTKGNFPLTPVETLTLTYENASVLATEEDIRGGAWYSFASRLFSKYPEFKEMSHSTHYLLQNENHQIGIHLDLYDYWAVEDNFDFIYDYTLKFQAGPEQP